MGNKLVELHPQHHAAIRLRLEGKKADEIAEELEVTLRTVHIWFSDPLVKNQMNELVARSNEIFAEKMALGGIVGMDELRAAVQAGYKDRPSPGTWLEIVRELMKYTPMAAAAMAGQEDEDGKPVPAVNFNMAFGNGAPAPDTAPPEQLSNEQLIEEAKRVAATVVDAEATEIDGSNESA